MTAAAHALARIAPVAFCFRPTYGPAVWLETDSSFVAFARLREAMRNREEVISFAQAGRDATAESLASLNAFLRACPCDPHFLHPWDRLPHAGHDSRYEWAELIRHLGITFADAV